MYTYTTDTCTCSMTITISIMKCIYIYTLEIIYIYYYSNTLVLSWIRICQFQTARSPCTLSAFHSCVSCPSCPWHLNTMLCSPVCTFHFLLSRSWTPQSQFLGICQSWPEHRQCLIQLPERWTSMGQSLTHQIFNDQRPAVIFFWHPNGQLMAYDQFDAIFEHQGPRLTTLTYSATVLSCSFWAVAAKLCC